MPPNPPYLYERFPPDLSIEMEEHFVMIDRDANFDDYDIVFLRKDLPEFIALLKEMYNQINYKLWEVGEL